MNGDLDVASVPGGGSSFVLVLPGPAAVDPLIVRSVLVRALEQEEAALEEQLVRDAIAAGRALTVSAGDATASVPKPRAGARLRVLPTIHPEAPASA